MGEGALIGRGFEGEFVGGHGVGGCRHNFGIAREAGAKSVRDGRSGRRWGGSGSSLSERDSWRKGKQSNRADETIHRSLLSGDRQDTLCTVALQELPQITKIN